MSFTFAFVFRARVPRSIALSVVASLWLLPGTSESFGRAPEDPPVANGLTAAREHAGELGETYAAFKKLAEKGSVSQQRLRRARHEFQLANLDVLELEHPDKRRHVKLAKAELEFLYRSGEFKIISRLYARGSVQKVEFERSKFFRDVAELAWEAAKDSKRTKLHDIKIAQRRLELLTQEHQRIKQLWKTKIVSQTVYDRWTRYLRNVEQDLVIAKKALGVRVIQVEPPSTLTADQDGK